MKNVRELTKEINELIFQGLPGAKAHSKMLPEGRLLTVSSRYRKSAVLILLYPKSGKWNTVFIKRNQYDGPHSGQISLPGGKKIDEDKTLLNTALRETFEETGVKAGDSYIALPLTPLHIPVSGFVVHPFIAVLDFTPTFNPEPNEVEYLIEVSLQKLKDPSVLKIKKMPIRGMEVNVPYYDIQGEVIWGATAMIVAEFLDLLGSIISD